MRKMLRGLAAAWVVALTAVAYAEVTVEKWTPVFVGIEHCTALATKDENNPRRQVVNALRIDLKAEGIEFYVTPQSGKHETVTQRTRDFLEANNLSVAVNGNFWLIKKNAYTVEEVDLLGLAISDGKLISPPQREAGCALTITSDKQARVCRTPADFDVKGIQWAVGGNALPLVDGKIVPEDQGIHPRTGAGISEDGRYLILLTIDGRQAGYSEGATIEELGQWLQRLGAYNGLNMDGGGSTTMVMADEAGKGTVLNRPCARVRGNGPAGRERLNGNSLGIRAKSLPKPANTTTTTSAPASQPQKASAPR